MHGAHSFERDSSQYTFLTLHLLYTSKQNSRISGCTLHASMASSLVLSVSMTN